MNSFTLQTLFSNSNIPMGCILPVSLSLSLSSSWVWLYQLSLVRLSEMSLNLLSANSAINNYSCATWISSWFSVIRTFACFRVQSHYLNTTVYTGDSDHNDIDTSYEVFCIEQFSLFSLTTWALVMQIGTRVYLCTYIHAYYRYVL